MSTRKETVEFLTEQMAEAGNIRSRAMFGEYGIYCDEKVVALVCDDQLYVKPTSTSHPFEADCQLAPPYPGAKMYLRVSSEKWDDSHWLSDFIRQTANSLPPPKPKK
jgi:DNA transformation protein